jgi:hypothetical protein
VLDPKKEASELFELSTLLRAKAYDLNLAVNMSVSRDHTQLIFKDVRQLTKKFAEKLEDVKRSME